MGVTYVLQPNHPDAAGNLAAHRAPCMRTNVLRTDMSTIFGMLLPAP